MTRNLSATAMSLLALALPGTALAQEDGVTVDPDSPTAKEYAIPIESARRDAAPADRSTATPLFGQGVTPEGETAETGGAPANDDVDGAGNGSVGSGDGRSGASPPKANSATPGTAEDQPTLEVVAQAASRPGAPSDGGTAVLVAGGGIALVAAAAGAGFMARRRRDPST